jgi:mannose/fructose/N-acetylgalactosamine-specific phosphotransferase system component IID
MRNGARFAVEGLTVPLQVPATAVMGQPLLVGSMVVIPITNRATTATINAGLAAPGLIDGEASCLVPGVQRTMWHTAPADYTLGVKIFIKSTDGTLTLTASGNTLYGYTVNAGLSGTQMEVALSAN